ncbi:hypothetical protein CBM2634_B170448 [Cupriavidus taiwanensis]|uniref:Uncharacterized protein n=1 Tax=Cupriavidus taiwanensis TaxID=164546 RepID=A0A375J967_9BURK|nr:hypothetical protein CBM2634_B170448 [Cupriavidus taiwanensis]
MRDALCAEFYDQAAHTGKGPFAHARPPWQSLSGAYESYLIRPDTS